MDEAEEPFSVGQTDGLATRLCPEDARSAPVAGKSTGVRGEQDRIDRAGRRAQILFVLLEVPAQGSRGENQSRRAVELRGFARPGSLL